MEYPRIPDAVGAAQQHVLSPLKNGLITAVHKNLTFSSLSPKNRSRHCGHNSHKVLLFLWCLK